MSSTLLGHTESLCPECLERIPAQRVLDGGDVYLVKECACHGSFRTVIWRGEPSLDSWYAPKVPAPPEIVQTSRSAGCPHDCGLCPDHAQQSCCVLLEVTKRCDLGCPICYASSDGKHAADPSLEDIEGWYRLLHRSAGPCNVQLSGGEPTLRDDLPDIVALGRETGFSFIQLNTNGLRLAQDRELAGRLKQAGLSTVFLQFDAVDDETGRRIRGRDVLEAKERAIEQCVAAGLGVVLVPTLVPRVNTGQIGALIDYALERLPGVRGVHFQPVSYFGRFPSPPTNRERFTLPELMAAIVAQTGGRIAPDSFVPSGCEHTLCSFHSDYLLMEDGSLRPLAAPAAAPSCCAPGNSEESVVKARAFVARRWAAPEEPAAGCPAAPAAGSTTTPEGCCTPQPAVCCTAAPAGDGLDAFLDRVRTHRFTLTAMAFQDAWTIDLERLRNCCVHVVSPQGTIVPFCSWNLTSSAGEPLHRRRA